MFVLLFFIFRGAGTAGGARTSTTADEDDFVPRQGEGSDDDLMAGERQAPGFQDPEDDSEKRGRKDKGGANKARTRKEQLLDEERGALGGKDVDDGEGSPVRAGEMKGKKTNKEEGEGRGGGLLGGFLGGLM